MVRAELLAASPGARDDGVGPGTAATGLLLISAIPSSPKHSLNGRVTRGGTCRNTCWNSAEYYERCRESWENTANAALERAGSAERIDRRSFLERGIARLPEPALRLAHYMHDLYGVLKDRFGQFQMARHYRAVEQAAKDAFASLGAGPTGTADAADAVRTQDRFFGWFDRQLARLEPAPVEHAPSHAQTIDPER